MEKNSTWEGGCRPFSLIYLHAEARDPCKQKITARILLRREETWAIMRPKPTGLGYIRSTRQIERCQSADDLPPLFLSFIFYFISSAPLGKETNERDRTLKITGSRAIEFLI
jgi:hypothetical protein